LVIKCSKCGYEGGRAEWKYVGNLNMIGSLAYRKCPGCGHFEVCDELTSDEQYRGPEPWGIGKFRGKVFKGKKKKTSQKTSIAT